MEEPLRVVPSPQEQKPIPESDPTKTNMLVGTDTAGDHPETFGMVRATEHSEGTFDPQTGDKNPAVEGLPVAGAFAEQAERDRLAQSEQFIPHDLDSEKWVRNYTQELGGLGGEKDFERLLKDYLNWIGEEAMVKEVRRRTEALVPEADFAVRKSLADAAEESLRAEFEAKYRTAEKRAELAQKRKEDTAKARALLEQIKAGAPLFDVLGSEAPTETRDSESQETVEPDHYSEQHYTVVGQTPVDAAPETPRPGMSPSETHTPPEPGNVGPQGPGGRDLPVR